MISNQSKFNQKYIKLRNQGLILRTLKDEGPMSRAELSKKLGLVRSTISEIINELVSANIIIEGKKVKGNLGKRPTLLYFNNEYYYFLANVIRPQGILSALCNLNGDILKMKEMAYYDVSSAKDVILFAIRNTDEIISDIDKSKIRLISLGSPETFNVRTGIIKWAPYIRDWVGIDLKSIFMDKYNIEVIIKDHVKLETIGEQWQSFPNVSNLVYIVVTKGIGAGIIIDGKVREGKNGYMGEIAFLPIAKELSYSEIIKSNKNLGYFESKCDISSITNVVKDYYIKKKNEFIDIDIKAVGALYNSNKEIKNIIDNDIIKTLALGISTLIITLDPELVVINGEIISLGEDFLKTLKNEVYKITPYKREIVYSKLEEKAGLYGAIKNGLNYIEDILFQNPALFYNLTF